MNPHSTFQSLAIVALPGLLFTYAASTEKTGPVAAGDRVVVTSKAMRILSMK